MFRNIRMGLSLEDETLTPEIDQALLDVEKLTSSAPEDVVEKTANEQEKQEEADKKVEGKEETPVNEETPTEDTEPNTKEESEETDSKDSKEKDESLPTLSAVAEELYKETNTYMDIVLESLTDTTYLCNAAITLENCKATNSLDNTTIKLTNSLISSVATRAGYPLAAKDKLSLESISSVSTRSTYVQESLSRIGVMIGKFLSMIVDLLKKAWSTFKDFIAFNSLRLNIIKNNLTKIRDSFKDIKEDPNASGSYSTKETYDKTYSYYLSVNNLTPKETLKTLLTSTLVKLSNHLAKKGRDTVKDLSDKSKLKNILLGTDVIKVRIEKSILPTNLLAVPNRTDIKKLNIPNEVSNLVSTYSCSLTGNTTLTAVVANNYISDEEYAKVMESNVLKLGIFKTDVVEQPKVIKLLDYSEIKETLDNVFEFHNELVLLTKQDQAFAKYGDHLINSIYTLLKENNSFDISDKADIDKVYLNISSYRSVINTLVKFYHKGMIDLGKYSLTVLDGFTDYIVESIKIHVKPSNN